MSLHADVHEADAVAARLGILIRDPTFFLSPEFLDVIHRRLFGGLFPLADHGLEQERSAGFQPCDVPGCRRFREARFKNMWMP